MPAPINFCYVFINCCGSGFVFSSIPDIRSVISNAGGMGTTGSPQVLLPKLIWDGYLSASPPSVR